MKGFFLSILLLVGSCFASPPASNSGLPLPRFASLRYKEVNLHVGPGREYPIEWKLIRQGMPVEITAEFDAWRRIRDFQGTTGWVHKSNLSGRRTIIIKSTHVIPLYKNPETTAPLILRLEPGVIADALAHKDSWCKVKVNKVEGWVMGKEIWGVYPSETTLR